MAILKKSLGLALLVASALAVSAEQSQAQSIKWRRSYSSARKEAAKYGKPILLKFTMVPCYWCDRLSKDTLSVAKIAKTINKEFVPIELNGPRQPFLTERLRVVSYPTVILADSDGRVLVTMEGYKNAKRFNELLQRALAQVANPEWMVRDYLAANKAVRSPADYAKAISLLTRVLEDGRKRPIQKKARILLNQIEERATQRFAQARQLNVAGKTTEAMHVLTSLVRRYPGTQSATKAGTMLTRLAKSPKAVGKERTLTASDLLGEAREFYRKEKYSNCLDVCGRLVEKFGDLPEADKARALQASIQTNTSWMEKSCSELGQKLSRRMLLLAEAYLKKNDRAKAMATYRRIITTFPDTRYARLADYHLRQLRGEPTVAIEFSDNQK